MEKMLFHQQDNIFAIYPHEIIFLKSDNSYTTIQINGGKSIFVSKSLAKLQKDLESHHFIRVNQSFLVNRRFIESVDKKKKQLLLEGNHCIHFTLSLKDLVGRLKTS